MRSNNFEGLYFSNSHNQSNYCVINQAGYQMMNSNQLKELFHDPNQLVLDMSLDSLATVYYKNRSLQMPPMEALVLEFVLKHGKIVFIEDLANELFSDAKNPLVAAKRCIEKVRFFLKDQFSDDLYKNLTIYGTYYLWDWEKEYTLVTKEH